MAIFLCFAPHVLSFLTLEELCHLAGVSKELKRFVYNDAGQRWESALEALQTSNCNNMCGFCEQLALSCDCEVGKDFMERIS